MLIGTATSMAQMTTSAYSKFGLGLLSDNASAAQRQMGGVGYATFSGRTINVMNPASYARIDSLTFLFDMGVTAAFINSEDAGEKLNQKGGGLDYITMQFPLSKRIGASVGLLPFSSVGYSFGSEIKNGSNAHQGSGGLNQLYAGLSYKILENLSAGLNVSYLFGNNVNDIYAYTDASTGTSSTSLFEQVIEVRDFHFNFGLLYNIKLDEINSLGFGLTYSPGKTLLGNAHVIKYDVTANELPDTVQTMSLKNNFSIPDTWGAGISYRRGRNLLVEADVTYQPWSNAKFADMADFPATKYADRWKVAAGVAWTPRERGSYFQVVTYRAGVHYSRDYMMVGDNNVREYGFGCGFGLPTRSTRTIINLGVEYRHRAAHPNPLLKENYWNITLGVNFNELWFFKRKID